MRFEKSLKCDKCFWADSTTCMEPDNIETPECYSDQQVLDEFNARSYVEESPEPLEAKMSFTRGLGKAFSHDVEVVPYISLGKRSPGIRYKGDTPLTNISSLWRWGNLNFKLGDGKVLAAYEVEEELYKQC